MATQEPTKCVGELVHPITDADGAHSFFGSADTSPARIPVVFKKKRFDMAKTCAAVASYIRTDLLCTPSWVFANIAGYDPEIACEFLRIGVGIKGHLLEDPVRINTEFTVAAAARGLLKAKVIDPSGRMIYNGMIYISQSHAQEWVAQCEFCVKFARIMCVRDETLLGHHPDRSDAEGVRRLFRCYAA